MDLHKLYYSVWPGKDTLKTSEFLIAENKVHVGKFDGHDAYVTYCYNHFNSFYDEDHIVYNIIFDFKTIKKEFGYTYDKWDFTLINDEDIASGEHEVRDYVDGQFKSPRIAKVEFFDDYKERIYKEVSRPQSIEISKNYYKLSQDLHKMRFKKEKSKEDFGLDYQTMFKEQDYLNKKYLNGIDDQSIKADLDRYKNMSEEEYAELRERERRLFADIDFESIIKRVKKKNESTYIKTFEKFKKK